MREFFVFFMLILTLNSNSLLINALECYTCSVASIEDGETSKCVNDPVNVEGSPTRTCDKKYCYTFRIEKKDEIDVVVSMSRGCNDVAPCETGISEDSTFRYYCTVCTEDLCNDGNGKTPTGSSGNHNYADGIGVLRVPGTGDAAPLLPNLFLLCMLLLLRAQ